MYTYAYNKHTQIYIYILPMQPLLKNGFVPPHINPTTQNQKDCSKAVGAVAGIDIIITFG